MKPKRTLSSWLTSRYLLIIRNEENFAEKTTFSFNYAKLIVFFFFLFIIFTTISIYLVNTILSQWFDPRHIQIQANKKVIELTMAVDSLEEEVNKKEQFILHVQNIMSGDAVNDKEEAERKSADSQSLYNLNKDLDLNTLPAIDSQIRSEFEDYEHSALKAQIGGNSFLQDLYFFSPLSGIISSTYNAKIEHYGVDVLAKSNEPVKSIADGTIILSSWTQDAGYVIAVQHHGNLISVYKHNSVLLKKVGNFVEAGDIISIIGNSGELTTGPHLHFELWHNGNPVNPEEYVSF